MKKLGLVDMIRFKAVCSCWYKAGKSYTSGLVYSPNNQSPWLMLPTHKGEDHSWLFNFAEQKEYKLKNVFQELGPGFVCPYCVGSSYGWLIIFDYRSDNGCLLNPFSGARIELPSTTNTIFSSDCITKAILSSDPTPYWSCTKSSFTIVIMYGIFNRHLAFYKYEDNHNSDNNYDHTWTNFSTFDFCSDIIYHNNHLLYALQHKNTDPLVSGRNGSVEVWDFGDYFPKKVATFKHPDALPLVNINPGGVQQYWYSYHIYLAKSLDDEILYVFLVSDSKVITIDHNYDSDTEYYIDNDNDTDHCYSDECYVYKLDYSGQRWEKIVKSFGDGGQSLFLGGNQCISISARKSPEWKENSLYITVLHDIDWWKRVRYFSDARKVRVYHLQEKAQNSSIELNMNSARRYSAPFWILPNLY